MKFASVRLVTQAFDRLVAFYETLSSTPAERLAEGFAQIPFPGLVLAISDEALIRRFNAGAAIAASNRSAILEFEVGAVDAVIERMQVAKAELVMPPTAMPWGNRSALLLDPDGNLVNVFSRPAAAA